MTKECLEAVIRKAMEEEKDLPLVEFHKGRVSAFEFVLSLLND